MKQAALQALAAANECLGVPQNGAGERRATWTASP